MDPIEEKLKLLRPFISPQQWGYLRIQYIFEKDFKKKKEVENIIDFLISQHVPGLKTDHILLPPPEKGMLAGEYRIGDVLYPDKPLGTFGVRENEWLRHCGIFGKTGSGKTTLAIRIIKELCRQKRPFLIFDYKRNYRDLLKHPDFENEEILVFTVGRNDVVPFYFNPKQRPAGMEEYVWIKQLSQIIEKVYLLGPGANDVFMESAGMGTFKEMQDNVLRQKKKARELLWWASVKRTLNAINYPGLGEMVNCIKGYPVSVIRKVFADGIKINAVVSDLSAGIKFLSEKEHERKNFLLPDQLNRLIEATQKNRAKHYLPAIIFLGAEHGASKQEILFLEWSNIKFDYDGVGLIKLFRTKNSMERIEFLMPRTKKALLDWKKHLEDRRRKNGIIKVKSDHVFCRIDGTPIKNFNRSWWAARREAGIKDFHFHDLRHTFCSNLIISGSGLKDAKEMIGHSDISMTDRYSHLTALHKRSRQQRLAEHYENNK
jgi:integrase